MYFLDFTYEAETFIPDGALKQPAVHTGKSDGIPAVTFHHVDQRLVDLPCQHHLRDVHGLSVRDAESVNEDSFFPQPLHQVGNFRTAAMHQHHPGADERKQYDILHDLLFQVFIDHGIAAVFDDNDLPVITADVGHGLDQHLSPLCVCNITMMH